MLATVISLFVELQLSSKVKSYSKYPRMHSSRATNGLGNKPVHSPRTSLAPSDQSSIPKGTGHSLLCRVKGEFPSTLQDHGMELASESGLPVKSGSQTLPS